MTENKLNVLLVEDDPGDVRLVQEMFKVSGAKEYELSVAGTLDDAIDALRKDRFIAILLDLNLPDSSGVNTIKSIRGNCSECAVVVLTGMDDETVAMETLKTGAEDFLVKGKFDASLLKRSLRYAIARKLAGKKLHESVIKYKTLFDNAGDAIFLMSDSTFLDCNFSTLKMFGVSREQILGQSPYRFSPPLQPDGRDSKEKAMEKIKAALDGQTQFFEWKHSKLDGTLFDAEVALNRIKVDGQIYLQAIVRDVTDRKNIESKLIEQLDELKRWQGVVLEREERVIELKNEVDELLLRLREPAKYDQEDAK